MTEGTPSDLTRMERLELRLPAVGQGALRLILALIQGIRRHRVSMLARQAAYSLLYAVPSVIVLAVSLANIVDKRSGSHLYDLLIQVIQDYVPAEFQALLIEIVEHSLLETDTGQATLAAIIAVGVAIWGGAGGTGALVFACNDVYDVGDRRSWFLRKALTLMITIFGAVIATIALVLFTLGEIIARWLDSEVRIDSRITGFLSSGRLIALMLIVVSLFLLYWIAPDVDQSFLWLIPGTLVASFGIVLTLTLVSTVLQVFSPGGGYGVAGVAGGMLVLLWFLYVISLIVVAGAVINAVIGELYDPRLIRFLRDHPERRVRSVAGTPQPSSD